MFVPRAELTTADAKERSNMWQKISNIKKGVADSDFKSKQWQHEEPIKRSSGRSWLNVPSVAQYEAISKSWTGFNNLYIITDCKEPPFSALFNSLIQTTGTHVVSPIENGAGPDKGFKKFKIEARK